MLVQSARAVARGPVARLVAEGARNTHEWTAEKNALLQAFDESGITGVFMEPSQGGFIEGPKNLALALVAFELAWVDAGAATGSLAGCLALSPIHERGTAEQRDYYMSRCAPPQPGEDRKPWRGAFCLTEPIPYVGVETGMLGGKVRVAEWKEGEEPMLQVEKRGRFITNMGFANFVTAAVDSDDPRIKGTCMVILEETDPGHSSTAARPRASWCTSFPPRAIPIFSLHVPASRIIGGYTVKDGVIVPRYSHGEIIEAVFRRTRVTVAIMTSAKLLSAVEPVIRYQRGPLPRRRHRHARLAALRAGPAAEGGCGAPPGGRLGHRRSQRRRWASRRRACSTSSTRWSAQKDEILAAARHRRRHGRDEGHAPGAEGRHRVPAAASAPRPGRTTRWCSTPCSIPWPTSSAPPASSGTPATAPA